MPSVAGTFGWPTGAAVLSKIATVAPVASLNSDQASDVAVVLEAVIADFQSPLGPNGSGGTGRNFTPVQETKVFDGGRSILYVPDIVPGSAIVVQAWQTVLVDAVLKTNYRGTGANVIVREAFGYFGGFGDYGRSIAFPPGVQNISVTTLWGYAATVPLDIADAVAEECAARILLKYAGISGIPQSYAGGGEEIEFARASRAGVAETPVSVMRANYKAKVQQYRDSEQWKTASIARRMV